MNNTSVTIVGAGWAGLAAAVELCRQDMPVTVYESAKQLGGRARSHNYQSKRLDNGQHLMIGAYQQMLQSLETIGVDEQQVFHRQPMQLQMLDIRHRRSVFELKLPRLPAPLHLLAGMMRCPSLSWTEKWLSLWRFNRLLNSQLDQDISVDQWLQQAQLPAPYVEFLLKPLCLAALTTHTQQASARAFQAVLQQTFNGPRANTDLLIPRTDLGQVFPQAARAYIESRGGRVITEQRVHGVQCNDQGVQQLIFNDHRVDVSQLILATPANITRRLLPQTDQFASIHQQLAALEYEPVTTIYLHYPAAVESPVTMLGLINSTAEWLFQPPHLKSAHTLAAVISAGGEHTALDKQALADTLAAELAQAFPHWPAVESSLVIREKRATFRCHPGIDPHRPGINTPVDNLRLCGDYVYIEENNAPGLPSTLEGAMRSGVKCAQQLIHNL